jgi:hypothetical protein
MAQMNSVAKARPRWGKFAAIFIYFTLLHRLSSAEKFVAQNSFIPELANFP